MNGGEIIVFSRPPERCASAVLGRLFGRRGVISTLRPDIRGAFDNHLTDERPWP
jgi:hypothetical protein